MSDENSAAGNDFETSVHRYLDRIKQIDSILKKPILTFLQAPYLPISDGWHPETELPDADTPPLVYPRWLLEGTAPYHEDGREQEDLDTQSVCLMTFQRLRRTHRRLSWLSTKELAVLKHAGPHLARVLGSGTGSDSKSLKKWLNSSVYGNLNPMTASQIFRVNLELGDSQAYTGPGLLAFFTMLWSLYKSFPDPMSRGARVEPWEPTAYVTAKCVIPLIQLKNICLQQKSVLLLIAHALTRIDEVAQKAVPSPHERWRFTAALEELQGHLHSMQSLAFNRAAFRDAENKIERELENLFLGSDLLRARDTVLDALENALDQLRRHAAELLEGAEAVLKWIDAEVTQPLKDRDTNRLESLGLLLNKSYLQSGNSEGKLRTKGVSRRRGASPYLEDLQSAAESACGMVSKALGVLRTVAAVEIRTERDVTTADDARVKVIVNALKGIARENDSVADGFDDPIRLAARWCKTIVDREIAFASARNITDFDPAELVSGMAVATRWGLMATHMQVRDGVNRALEAVWSDGSWRLGRPFFRKEALGSWPPTADVLSTLASVIKVQPSVNEADHALFSYVDWLERTQRTIRMKDGETATGWSADRIREPTRIHLPTTALSITVLLKIRSLVEHRLWELCQKRFTVRTDNRRLHDVFPVDLNQPHGNRFHAELTRMANLGRTRSDGAIYSIILHGPPGSSKTAISEALSQQVWTQAQRWGPREARLIRITPADFTRRGEDRLDSEARLIFDLLLHVRGVTILFDEIDDLLLRREATGGRRFMDLIVPAMLNRLQDLRSSCPHQEICFVLGTNFVENIEPALMRKGRIDRTYPVVYPDWNSRQATISSHFDSILKAGGNGGGAGEVSSWAHEHVKSLAVKTAGWPWLVVNSLCADIARKARGLDLTTAEYRQKLNGEIDWALAQERGRLAEPAYIGRLLRRFDSPELLSEYLQHLISRTNQATNAKTLVGVAKRDAETFINAHFPEEERDRHLQVWSGHIMPLLEQRLDTLLQQKVDYLT